MSSVLHPVGPEPQERYWVRRVGLLAAILVALSIVIALVVNATSAGSAVQSGVPVAPVVPAAAPASESASPTPTTTPTSTSPTPSTSASPKPSASATPTTSPEPSATPSSSSKKSDAGKKSSGKSSSSKKTATPALAACPNASLRATITGNPNPKVQTPTTFSLSLINGSKSSCVIKVYGGNATLTVVSGSDRIWTSTDCSTSVPQTVTTLKPEQAVSWKVTWNGQRSKAGCQNRPEKPRPGYYWAIATFANLDPVRTRLIVHA